MPRPFALSSDRDVSAEDALAMALHSEALAHQCGVHDPAFHFLCRERDWWLNEAASLERSDIVTSR